MNFQKIGKCLGIVYDVLKDKENGLELIAKVDEVSSDIELIKGFREIIIYMKNNKMEETAKILENNINDWLRE